MNEKANARLTFAMLDRQKGIEQLPSTKEEEYPLPAWYRAVYETPLDELGLEDICKACRQHIHLEYVVPIALQLLKAKPLAGEMYDGELLISLKAAPSDYWPGHRDEGSSLKSIIESVRQSENTDEDLQRDLQELLVKVG